MGFTYDLIPVLEGEDPKQAFERVYADGTMISFDDDPPTIGTLPTNTNDREVPAAWQREAAAIAQRVFPHWQVRDGDDDGTTAVTLWSPGSTVSLTVYEDSITIRRNRWPELGPACDELALLRAFGASGCVLASGDFPGGMFVADIRTEDPEPYVPLFG